MKVIQSVGDGCDEEAIKAVKRIYKLFKKYDPEACKESERIIPIIFRLE